jgi:hypothetical protein
MEKYGLRVFENKILKNIFEPKREEITESWRKLHKQELHNSYSSPIIIQVIKSRSMKREWHDGV